MVIFCKSRASAEQTLAHIIPYIEKKLFLKVNREKTVVAYAGRIKFLGYGFYKGKDGFHMRVHKKTKQKTQKRVKELTSRKRVNDRKEWQKAIKQYVTGWINYYKLADMAGFLGEMDEHMRRRIRMVFWKRWKRVRTRYANLRKLGVEHDNARAYSNTRKDYWQIAGSPILTATLTNQRLERDGFVFFSVYYRSVKA